MPKKNKNGNRKRDKVKRDLLRQRTVCPTFIEVEEQESGVKRRLFSQHAGSGHKIGSMEAGSVEAGYVEDWIMEIYNTPMLARLVAHIPKGMEAGSVEELEKVCDEIELSYHASAVRLICAGLAGTWDPCSFKSRYGKV